MLLYVFYVSNILFDNNFTNVDLKQTSGISYNYGHLESMFFSPLVGASLGVKTGSKIEPKITMENIFFNKITTFLIRNRR